MLVSDNIKEFDNIWSATEVLQDFDLSLDLDKYHQQQFKSMYTIAIKSFDGRSSKLETREDRKKLHQRIHNDTKLAKISSIIDWFIFYIFIR